MSLKDRFYTRSVAEAMMSPSGILAAGAGAAVSIAAGLPVVVAAVAGAGLWVARVGVAMANAPSSGPSRARVRRVTLASPWQSYVDESLQARGRFEQAVERTRPGPVRERLARLSDRIDRFVDHSYTVAESGQQLSQARALIDADAITRDLARIELGPTPPQPGSASARAADALKAQLASVQRMDATIADTRAQLTLIDARLDELVTRAIELSVRGSDPSVLGSVEDELGGLLDELEAVRQAVAETG